MSTRNKIIAVTLTLIDFGMWAIVFAYIYNIAGNSWWVALSLLVFIPLVPFYIAIENGEK